MTEQENLQNNTKENKNRFIKIPVMVLLASLLAGFVAGGVGGGMVAWKYVKNMPGGKVSQSVKLEEDSAVIEIVKKASPAVVNIIATKDVSKYRNFAFDPFGDDFFSPFFGMPKQSEPKNSEPNFQQVGAGSGFFISENGLILTNKHVVEDEGAKYTVITYDDKEYEAEVVARDPKNDLALIKINIQKSPFLTLADSGEIEIGQRVVAIGNSLGQYHNTVTTGIVSGIGRSITAGSDSGEEQLSGVIQTDAAINPGNSGGPLLNILGEVVGINTAINRQGQLIGFAIPSVDAKKALESYEKNGKITRPYLGVRYIMLTEELAKKQNLPKNYGGLLARGENITDFAVVPGSPADKAGLVENDIILEVEGKRVEGKNTLAELIKDKNVGDSVNLRVYHKGDEKNMTIILGEIK